MNANPAFTRQFPQTNGAHDLKSLLERMPRQGKTYVYGVSYGTGLVLRTLALGAPEIDGVILDSLVPLQEDRAGRGGEADSHARVLPARKKRACCFPAASRGIWSARRCRPTDATACSRACLDACRRRS